VLVVVAFQVLRLWDEPIGYLPSVGDLLNIPLFRLPGQHIEGLPAFIAGPGDPVTALHILIAVLGGVLVATAVTGFIMARGFARLDETVRNADKLPPTPVDRMLPAVEQRIASLREPRSRRFVPRNPIDGLLVGLNVLLLLVIAGIVAFYVVPSYSQVAAVDRAVEATRVAALASPTPAGGGGGGEGPTEAEAVQAELAALPAGTAGGGQQVFNTAGCAACHALVPDQVIVGPSLAGVGARAGTRREGFTPETYLYQSIVNPNAYVVEGFQPGLMPQTFRQTLTDQQLADLVAFLATQ
jgi:hypothetical protein